VMRRDGVFGEHLHTEGHQSLGGEMADGGGEVGGV
jgi:hypothetical protein